ncbi:MAG: CpaF family protein, partial [Ruegeria pomeroyi]|nr:CpaF family protein [Ruegeria pomeroyi]
MFSRYKKTDKAMPVAAMAAKKAETPAAAVEPVASASLRRPAQKQAAEVVPQDRDRKRKERLSELKIELHRDLLENLNLSALEHAAEAELRAEITAITSEVLETKGVVLNREDRMQLNKELYDEVTGLGPLETLLQDDTVNDILVNGPQQIF